MDIHSRQARRIAGAIFVVSLLATVLLGMRTYHSYLLLRSSRQANTPAISSIQPWMTLDYLSATFHVSDAALINGLELPSATDTNMSLRRLARRQGESPSAYVGRVRTVIVHAEPRGSTAAAGAGSEGSGALANQALAGVLTYGYYALGLTVLLGSIGLPLADALAIAVAGSLVAQGRMKWGAAAAVSLGAAVLGDTIAYLLGHVLNRGLLERYGRWFGYTPAHAARVMHLFKRWGGWTILLTRTFASYLSSPASILAGVSRYALRPYFAFTITGRLLWTMAYLGAGYAVAMDLQAATEFLANLSAMLIALAVLAASGWIAFGPAHEPSSIQF